MPLDYDATTQIPFGERDLLYGLDTGQLKLRYYFYTNYITQAQRLTIWDGHLLDQHKIDYLTQSMGPTPPVAWATKFGTAKTFTPSSQKNPGRSASSALPSTWTTGSVKGDFRDVDRTEFIEWIQKTRYTPASSAAPYQWNARFKRTSKAGLFWALFVKGYNVHFIVDKNLDYGEVVGGSKHGQGYKTLQYHAQYPTDAVGSSPDTTDVEEKRITYAELRWLYRYREHATVAQRVQFWENMSTAQEYKAVPAPWSTKSDLRKSSSWARYKPQMTPRTSDDDDMAVFLKTNDKSYLAPSTQRVILTTCDTNGDLTVV
jgi:hypothetical protein